MQKNPAPALILWTITAQIFMGIVAYEYEWLPTCYRGSWIFLILLLIAGAFLNIGAIKPISTQNTNSIADTKSISHI